MNVQLPPGVLDVLNDDPPAEVVIGPKHTPSAAGVPLGAGSSLNVHHFPFLTLP
jgi:hypothetical protein